MKPVVYLGPSLSLVEAKQLLDAEYRPPIKRGDLVTLSGNSSVLIIDGEFKQNLSVSPKEILSIIDAGRTVIGASSMGALRAAELAPYGMIGVGWVYESYYVGRIMGDDEVALTFSPMNNKPLTVPLVNVRCWFERLQARGLIDKVKIQQVLRKIRAIYYEDRTVSCLYQELEASLGKETFDNLLSAEGGEITDIKAEDARKALILLAEMIKLE